MTTPPITSADGESRAQAKPITIDDEDGAATSPSTLWAEAGAGVDATAAAAPNQRDGDEEGNGESPESERGSGSRSRSKTGPGTETADVDADPDALLDDEPDLEEDKAEERYKAAVEAKERGNAAYRSGDAESAAAAYSEAIDIVPRIKRLRIERAVFFANRAACWLNMDNPGEAVSDCTKALELHPRYLKALMRRCQAYESASLDKPELALKDASRALEVEAEVEAKAKAEIESGSGSDAQAPALSLAQPSVTVAALSAVRRLKPMVEAKQEREKEEMLSNLKRLGNTLLGKIGLSLDQFQAVKDPATGSYSISFNQGQGQG